MLVRYFRHGIREEGAEKLKLINKTIRVLLLSLVICMVAACAAGPGANAVTVEVPAINYTNTPSPTLEPTITPTITPTQTPEIPDGRISEDEVKEGEYSNIIRDDFFPSHMREFMNQEEQDIYDMMYKESRWTDEGFEIITPQGDVILIGKSVEIDNNLVEFSFFKNGEKISTIQCSRGTLIKLVTRTPPEPEEGYPKVHITWGYYSPTDSVFWRVEDWGEFGVMFYPQYAIVIYVDPDYSWLPSTLIKGAEEFASLEHNCENLSLSWPWFVENVLVEHYPQEKLEIVKTRLLTYKLPNGEFYRWGPPPLPCPYLEITYP